MSDLRARSTASSATRCGSWSSTPSEAVELDGYRIGAVRGRAPASRRSATRWSRRTGPGRFDPERAPRARRRPGPATSAASSAARRSRRTAGGRARAGDGRAAAGRKLVLSGDTAPCETTRRGGARRRPARARGDLPRGGGRARRADGALDRPAGGRAGARRRGVACSRSRTSRRATSRREIEKRRARCSSAPSCRATST